MIKEQSKILESHLGNYAKMFGGSVTMDVFHSMDDYAKLKSIQFAKWINKEGYREYDGSDRWISPTISNTVYSTKQLYDLFIDKK